MILIEHDCGQLTDPAVKLCLQFIFLLQSLWSFRFVPLCPHRLLWDFNELFKWINLSGRTDWHLIVGRDIKQFCDQNPLCTHALSGQFRAL